MSLINGYIYVAQPTEDGMKNFKMLSRLIDENGNVSYSLSYLDNVGVMVGPDSISIDEMFDLVSGIKLEEAKQRTKEYYEYWNNEEQNNE